jgi:hypothetical protein
MQVSSYSPAVEADVARESHALAFRIAFAAAVGLTLGELQGWDFPFLPAMLAVHAMSRLERGAIVWCLGCGSPR